MPKRVPVVKASFPEPRDSSSDDFVFKSNGQRLLQEKTPPEKITFLYGSSWSCSLLRSISFGSKLQFRDPPLHCNREEAKGNQGQPQPQPRPLPPAPQNQRKKSPSSILSFPHLCIIQEGELNPALRFANVTFWWFLLCGLQWLVAWGITERYVLEQPELRYC